LHESIVQVKEAEEFAEQDKKEKERVDARNHLESLIFQVRAHTYTQTKEGRNAEEGQGRGRRLRSSK
jgi:molecular chaperone DnaK